MVIKAFAALVSYGVPIMSIRYMTVPDTVAVLSTSFHVKLLMW